MMFNVKKCHKKNNMLKFLIKGQHAELEKLTNFYLVPCHLHDVVKSFL